MNERQNVGLKKVETVCLKEGRNQISFRRTNDGKNMTISEFVVCNPNGKAKQLDSKEIDNIYLLEFNDNEIATILQMNNEGKFECINGVFCAIWCEVTKKKEYIHFVWFNPINDRRQHIQVKMYGFDRSVMMKIIRAILSCLSELMVSIPAIEFDDFSDTRLSEEKGGLENGRA